MTPEDLVTGYLKAIESHDPAQVEAYLHDDVRTTEHPNRVTPRGAVYDLAAMRAAGERGRALMASERYDVRQMTTQGDRVVVQLVWSGTLARAAGPLPAGHVMRAQICSIIELKDGKVWRQEQYDCFE